MSYPLLYRKRLIPSECIPLKDDRILRFDSELIITAWNTLKPRKDFHHGFSCFYRKEGWKISRFLKEDNSLKYVYCDIVAYEPDEENNTLTIVDLLADVIIYPDGFVKVVDLDELAEAVCKGLLSAEQLNSCLISLNTLLNKIYSGKLEELLSPISSL